MYRTESYVPARYVLTCQMGVIVTDHPKECDRLGGQVIVVPDVTVTHVGAGWQCWSDGVTTSGLWAGVRPPSRLAPPAVAGRVHSSEFLAEAYLTKGWTHTPTPEDAPPVDGLRAALLHNGAHRELVRAVRVHDEDVADNAEHCDRYWSSVDKYVYGDCTVYVATAGTRRVDQDDPRLETSSLVFPSTAEAVEWAREEARYLVG
ncbi:hypothetical protein [Streptomyces sp. MJM8645]|uniref:hypothetical protein n=1 Tax=Streptomycetaceae TaxID=2062 RepID=UPI0007AFA958|nr:hypothetical protein [Streptomyces sp. MJM8645]